MKIAVIGRCLAKYDDKESGNKIYQGPVGVGANIAHNLAVLNEVYETKGNEIFFITHLGGKKDKPSNDAMSMFEKSGINTSMIRRIEGKELAEVHVREVNEDGQDRQYYEHLEDRPETNFFESKAQVDTFTRSIADNGIDMIVYSSLMTASAENKGLADYFIQQIGESDVKLVYADNFRADWCPDAEDTKNHSFAAFANADRVFASIDDAKLYMSPDVGSMTAAALIANQNHNATVTVTNGGGNIITMLPGAVNNISRTRPKDYLTGEMHTSGAGDMQASATIFLEALYYKDAAADAAEEPELVQAQTTRNTAIASRMAEAVLRCPYDNLAAARDADFDTQLPGEKEMRLIGDKAMINARFR